MILRISARAKGFKASLENLILALFSSMLSFQSSQINCSVSLRYWLQALLIPASHRCSHHPSQINTLQAPSSPSPALYKPHKMDNPHCPTLVQGLRKISPRSISYKSGRLNLCKIYVNCMLNLCKTRWKRLAFQFAVSQMKYDQILNR